MPSDERARQFEFTVTKDSPHTLPTTLRDVDSSARLHRVNAELHVVGYTRRRSRRALALLDGARDAAADLELRDIHSMEVKSADVDADT